MGRLSYTYHVSLDGYVEDAEGSFDWSAPDEEAHAFINDLERSFGTQLLGRRMYETMAVWDTDPSLADDPVGAEFAGIWQAMDKVVYSTTLTSAPTPRTRIERSFDPDTVRALKASTEHELGVSGAELAGHALRAGLVDEVRLFVLPVVVGGGKPVFPPGLRLELRPLEARAFAGGMTYLRYAVQADGGS